MIVLSFLNELAKYVDGRMAKVVINGAYEIMGLEMKQVTANVLALNYVVPTANDTMPTSNPVNMLITADHMMLQTITIKEAV